MKFLLIAGLVLGSVASADAHFVGNPPTAPVAHELKLAQWWYPKSESCSRYDLLTKLKNSGKVNIDLSPWFDYSGGCRSWI